MRSVLVHKRWGYELWKGVPDPPPPAPYPFPPGHAPVKPLATYSPWMEDKEFQRVYAVIEKNTMVDEYRCYELWALARQTERLDGAILEVGVWKGGTGCLLAAATKKLVFLCDTFSGVIKAGPRDTRYKGGEHADATIEEVASLANLLGVSGHIRILRGIYPEETGYTIKIETLSLCHIDVDTHDSARVVFDAAWPQMVIGGVVVFDDYGFDGCEGVTRFVNENRKGLLIHNLNGHAIVVKTQAAHFYAYA
jgi:O-methyltransferase